MFIHCAIKLSLPQRAGDSMGLTDPDTETLYLCFSRLRMVDLKGLYLCFLTMVRSIVILIVCN